MKIENGPVTTPARIPLVGDVFYHLGTGPFLRVSPKRNESANAVSLHDGQAMTFAFTMPPSEYTVVDAKLVVAQ